MYKVRISLKNAMWIVSDGVNNDLHYSPDKYSLILYDCTLRNIPRLATQIKKGGKKAVCAWIETKSYQLIDKKDIEVSNLKKIRFNPKYLPYWIDETDKNIDDFKIDKIITFNRNLFINEVEVKKLI